MTDLVMIFLAQFFLIFLMGIQSLNVKDGHTILAAITSGGLSVCGFYVTGATAQAFEHGLFTMFGMTFVISGMAGIVFAIKTHKYVVKVYNFCTHFKEIW